MHYGLIAPELHGHLNPMTTVGTELVKRGHRVTLLSSQNGKAFADRSGIEWLPLNDSPEAMVGWDQLGDLSGLSALMKTGVLIQQAVTATRAEAPALIRQGKFDALLVDQFSPAGAVVAEEMGLPYVVMCNAVATHLDAAVPPPPWPWAPRNDLFGRVRNRFGNRIGRILFDTFSGAWKAKGVSPLLLTSLERTYGRAIVSQQPAWFDFPTQPRPPHFHYTAPWHVEGRDADTDFRWDWLDGRPLVYASMGTIQNRLKRVYHAIVEAARGLEIQLVLSLGSPSATLELDGPENVMVVPFAPQLRLLERASAVITHAGLNTTLETLARGLPMLCLPVTNDQPGIASRVVYLGAGRRLGLRRVTVEAIHDGIRRLLFNPDYASIAEQLQERLVGMNGPRVAAEIIERVTTDHVDS